MFRFSFAPLVLIGCAQLPVASWAPLQSPLPSERHLAWIRQLTTNIPHGTHAEAYFSPDGQRLILQARREGDKADQIYVLDLASGAIKRLSSGKGKTTCAYFLPNGDFIYSSTHHHGDEPPPEPDRRKEYVWPLYRTFDIFRSTGSSLIQLTQNDGYDAEATVSPDGKRIVFTSYREGGIGLWTMNVDGSDLRKVNHRRGYAGGAFFSPDGQSLIYRAFYPSNDKEEALWQRMLKEHVLVPVPMEIYVSRTDGSEERAITKSGKVCFAPFFHPDNKRILFCSNIGAKHRGEYALWLIHGDGSGLERVTFSEGTDQHPAFDGFPCFSPDGTLLAWISNRSGDHLNVFLAGWRD